MPPPDAYRRIAQEGEDIEVRALMANRRRRHVLRDVFARTGCMEGLSEDRWWRLVQHSAWNDGLNVYERYEDGPDLESVDIHKALFGLLQTAPLDRRWVRVLYDLMMRVNPEHLHTPDSTAAAAAVIERWRGVVVRLEHDEGHYSDLSIVDEFR